MGKDLTKVNKIVFMCSGSSCTKKGGDRNILTLRKTIEDQSLKEQVHTIKTLCTGQCESGPVMLVFPEGVWYKNINESRAERIITSHIMRGQYLDNVLYAEGDSQMNTVIKPAE